MEISKTECKRILRTLELKAYRSVVDALRAQGALTANKHEVLKNLAATLKIGEERYRSEMRRAANDDLLNTIAQCIHGKNTEAKWRAESVKKVPLTPIVASHTAFTVLADAISDIVSLENEKFSGSGELNNVVESYKCQNDENLEKYQSSKVLESLLKKRKNHHENSILSELENIKLNSNYHSSPIKSGYIEIAYDENFNGSDTQERNFFCDEMNSSFEAPLSPSCEKLSSQEKNSESTETSSSSLEIKSDMKQKGKKSEDKISSDRLLPNTSKIQNTDRTRNLRLKPLKKYTWNSVEIRSYEEEDTEKAYPQIIDHKPVNDIRRNPNKKQQSHKTRESHSEINNAKSLKSRKSDRRNRNRAKFVRKNKIGRIRKFAPSSKMKTDTNKEVPSRTSRISSRNARRRNYARIASGDYDLLEFENLKKEKKIEDEQSKIEHCETRDTDEDTFSDSSAAPIEISYSNPAVPKSSDFDLDGVSGNYTETDDDMKPHTFNLIPASRRLKMLKKRPTSPSSEEIPVKQNFLPKKRALSPSGEETPAKQNALSSQLNNDQSVALVTKSLLDINALKKVLAAHENSGNLISSSLGDASDITDTKETVDTNDRSQSSCSAAEIKEAKPPFFIPPRSVPEKKVAKPKMRLSEASTIENLHSLLSKVKEGDLKRHTSESSYKKNSLLKRKKDCKNSPRPASPIVNNCNGTLIEVGSDSGSVDCDNSEALSINNDSKNQISVENNIKVNTKVKPSNELEKNPTPVNEEEIVSISFDDFEGPKKCNVSEQLIDIESADIIIGDSSDQFILTSKNSAISAPETKHHDSKLTETLTLPHSSTNYVQNDEIIEQKDKIVTINLKKDGNKLLQNDLRSPEMDSNNIKLKSNVPIISRPTMEKMLSASADFRYKADSDDSLLKPSSSHLVTVAVLSGLPVTTESLAKYSGTIKVKSSNTIVVSPKIVNSSTKLLPNKTNESNLTHNSIFINDRRFYLLDTKSIAGSKSLLKPIKIPPKTVIAKKVPIDTNSTIQKPKMLSIHSSLKNLNEFTSSVNPVTIKNNVPFKGVETKSANALPLNNNGTVVLKPAHEGNSKKFIFSQTSENSLKSIGITKNYIHTTIPTVPKNIEPPENIDKKTEISSSDSREDKTVSSESNSGNVSSTSMSNDMQTFFSKSIIKKQS